MVCAGKYGLAVLSLNTISVPGAAAPDLAKFWDIAEETADKYGNTVSRDDWGIVIHVHLAESRKEAIEQAREASGRYQKEYFEDTLGLPTAFEGPQDKIIDHMVATNNWCVGTPDDLVDTIHFALKRSLADLEDSSFRPPSGVHESRSSTATSSLPAT